MKEVEYLTRAYGEYQDTPRSIETPYVGQDYDKEAIHPTIRNSDDWRPTSKALYAVETVEIPEWLEPKEYNSYVVHNWKWYKKIGGTEDLGREAFFKLINIEDGVIRLALVKLLKQKSFRSEFRKSLRLQLDKWIQEEDTNYQYPFSAKQMSYVTNDYIRTEAKQIGVA